MNPTTDPRRPRRSPAHRSKITASVLSGGAVLAIVTAMAANAPGRFAGADADHGQGGGVGAAPSTAATPGLSDRAATAAVPAPAPDRSVVTAPHGVSRGSGG